ncbi:Oxidoreductase [Klebsiella pneumoniae subsp. pneumoniae]|uniref:Oxidoreductase n=1 Tax=Klebsiella pneumoniae subsp. pneumoniae TaxID=72407 RepID=A0A377ZJ45_KLEPN|nr:Oxidoreductase [Klebsiella pneumoniae subsp. pneumoniae]
MNATTQNQRYALQELEKEALMGAEGEETFAREVRCIDLSNFAARKNDIAEQLWGGGGGDRLLPGQPSRYSAAEIRQAFSMTEAFFDLPDEVKRQYPLAGNAGWESKAQVRPSTRTRIKKSPIR